MHIFYLCNGKKCAGVDCEGKRLNGMTPIRFYADNSHQLLYLSECCLTCNANYAKNGPIKGPIDLIKRFRIHLRPYVYLEEKNGKKNSR